MSMPTRFDCGKRQAHYGKRDKFDNTSCMVATGCQYLGDHKA